MLYKSSWLAYHTKTCSTGTHTLSSRVKGAYSKRCYAAPSKAIKEQRKVPVLVVGGGTAGIAVSSIIGKTNEVLIVDPSDKHYYQPAWTLVGGGLYNAEKTEKPMSAVIPKGAEHLRDAIVEFDPEKNIARTADGVEITYDYMFVCSGLQINWDQIKGLPQALEDPESRVSSNYSYKYAPKTFSNIEKFKRGNAIFTHPAGPVKCAGAPQKAMYLADSYFKKKAKNANVQFFIGAPVIFGAPPFRQPLLDLIKKRGISANFNMDLVEVISDKHEAVFKNLESGELSNVQYSLLHVTPKMSAPDFIKNSVLANEAGFVDVDQYTLQHKKYPNIFSLGDSSSLPTSKTAAAIASQVPVAVSNFLSYKAGIDFVKKYDGYTACPIVTEEGKVILAEFDYEFNPRPTFPVDPTKESSYNYFLKKNVFPTLYWNGLLKGRWRGPKQLPWKRFSKN